MDNSTNSNSDWLADDVVPTVAEPTLLTPWSLLVVDDEADVHTVTRMALRKVTYKGRPLEIVSAYSAQEGLAALRDGPEFALVLLDVVMEEPDSGLKLARQIRGELNNALIRIVLRTGQPGQAPEQSVIVDYDINDYKAKTDLTSQRLFTTVIAALRAFEGLKSIETNRLGLEKILEATSNLYQLDSLKELASGVLTQVGGILSFGPDGLLCVMRDKSDHAETDPQVIAVAGQAKHGHQAPLERTALPADHRWAPLIFQAFSDRKNVFGHPVSVFYFESSYGHQFAMALCAPRPLADFEFALLKVFCNRISAAFDNLHIFGLLHATEEATVVALADLAEFRDATTGGHVRRVCRLTNAIAQELQAEGKFADIMTPAFMNHVGVGSILHDVGKVATPDAVLFKPGRHTPEERIIMEQHAMVGETALASAARMIEGVSSLSIGAQIAGGHHEHFDGRGYPRGLRGQDIPLAARIVAIVDVFDALLHSRPYKEAWPYDTVIAYLLERRGTQFDPDVLDALLKFLDRDKPTWIIEEGH